VITPGDTILMVGGKISVDISCEDKDATIRYTTDANMPNEDSPVYSKPLEISSQNIVKAQAYKNGYNPSNIFEANYSFVDPRVNGIIWKLYEGKFLQVPDFDKLKPDASGTVFQFDLRKMNISKRAFALLLESYIQIDKDGNYEFSTSSNDGSKLYIDKKLIVDNDGEHGTRQISGKVYLTKGRHLISVSYFQSGGSKSLLVDYKSDKIVNQLIPASILFIPGK